MKKLFALLGVMLFSVSAFGIDTKTTYSSMTQTTESLARIPNVRTLESVIISSTATAGSIKIYDSSATATHQIAEISMSAVHSYDFDLYISSGLTYTTTSNTGSITLIYTKL